MLDNNPIKIGILGNNSVKIRIFGNNSVNNTIVPRSMQQASGKKGTNWSKIASYSSDFPMVASGADSYRHPEGANELWRPSVRLHWGFLLKNNFECAIGVFVLIIIHVVLHAVLHEWKNSNSKCRSYMSKRSSEMNIMNTKCYKLIILCLVWMHYIPALMWF